MHNFDLPTLHTLAGDLAANWLDLYRSRGNHTPPAAPASGQLAETLLPGVAGFLCVLTGALPGRESWLRDIARRFLSDPDTAGAFDRLHAGQDSALDDLAQLFLRAGMSPDALNRSTFDQAATVLLAAADASARRLTGEPLLHALAPLRPPGARGDESPVSDALRSEIATFIAALAAGGLGYVYAGRVYAADGTTVLYGAPAAWAIGGREEPAESAPPGETAAEANGGSAGPPPMPPPPSPGMPPPPAPEPPVAVALRLDAALPEQVMVGRAFDLAVAVRRAGSPPLAPDDLARRESADFAALWPAGAVFLQLRIQISAPDCDIHGEDSRAVRLMAGSDGPPVYFQLTPRRAGRLSVIITVYQETDWIGSTRLLTEAGDETPRVALAMTVESRPLGDSDANLLALRRALDDGYSDSELRDLCFEMGIDYEDLPGDSQAAKARELVLFARRRDLLAGLVALVMRDRAHLLVQE